MTNHLLLKMLSSATFRNVVFFRKYSVTGHTTHLNGFTSDLIPMDNSIGQGKPSLMILYLIYIYVLPAIPPFSSNGGYMWGTPFGPPVTHLRTV